MDARAAGGTAADRTSRTSHNAKCTMQDKQNISKCRTSRISQSTMQEKQNFTVYCRQVMYNAQCRSAGQVEQPTMQLTNTRPTMPPEPTHKQIGLLRWLPYYPVQRYCQLLPSPKMLGHQNAPTMRHWLHCFPPPRCRKGGFTESMLDLIHRARHSCTKSCTNVCIFSVGNKNKASRQIGRRQ